MINVTDHPNKVELVLTQEKNLRFGIYDFAISLIDIQIRWQSNIINIDKKKIHWVDFWKVEIERFEKLKSHIINTINNHIKRTDSWRPKVVEPNKSKFETNKSKTEHIINTYKLEPFFEFVGKEINIFKKTSKKTRRKGRPVELKSKIGLLWSLVIKESRGVDWKFIADLIDWFGYNLRETYFEKELIGKNGITDYFFLKRQILDLKNQKDHIEMARKLKIYYFPEQKNKRIKLINFIKKGATFYDIALLKLEIEGHLKLGGTIKEIISKNNLIDYYLEHKTVPLIIFPNGKIFP